MLFPLQACLNLRREEMYLLYEAYKSDLAVVSHIHVDGKLPNSKLLI